MLLVSIAGVQAEPTITWSEVPSEHPVWSFTVTEDGKNLVLCHWKSNLVTVLDLDGQGKPQQLAIDNPIYALSRGGKIYVANYGSGTISVLASSQGTWRIDNQFEAGSPHPYHLTARRGALYDGQLLVACEGETSTILTTVDTTRDTVRVLNKYAGTSTMEADATGEYFVSHGARSPSTYQLGGFRWSEVLSGQNSQQIASSQSANCLTPIGMSPLWVGSPDVFFGAPMPMKKMPVKLGQILIPAIDGSLVFSLEEKSVTAYRLTVPPTRLTAIATAYPEKFTPSATFMRSSKPYNTAYSVAVPTASGFLLVLADFAQSKVFLGRLEGLEIGELPAFTPEPDSLSKWPLPYVVTAVELDESGKYLIVCHEGDNAITVWDAWSLAKVAEVKVPQPRHAIFRDGQLYVANYGKGTISVISPSDDWRIVSVIAVDNTEVYYLSAPKGEYFKGYLVATCGHYRRLEAFEIAIAGQTARKLATGSDYSYMNSDYCGENLLGQSDTKSNPSGHPAVHSWQPGANDPLGPIRRGNFEAAPVLRQFRRGPLWVGETGVFSGFPPARAEKNYSGIYVPDINGDYVYVLDGKRGVRAMRLDESLAFVAEKPIKLSAMRTFSVRPGFNDQYAPYEPIAVRRGGHVRMFVPQEEVGFCYLVDVTLELAPAAVANSTEAPPADGTGETTAVTGSEATAQPSTPPEVLAVGASLRYPLVKDAPQGKFDILLGPKGATVDDRGVLTWKPTPEQLGAQPFKIRGEVGGKTEFHRFSIVVVPAGAATASASGVDVGRHFLLQDQVDLVTTADGSQLCLLAGNVLRLLDADGLREIRRLELPNAYSLLRCRDSYWIAARGDTIDFLSPETGEVLKTFTMRRSRITDLALQPGTRMSYLAATLSSESGAEGLGRFPIVELNEESGELRAVDGGFATWLSFTPDGSYLLAGFHYWHNVGMGANPLRGMRLPDVDQVDILIRYVLQEGEIALDAGHAAPGRNGGSMQVSPDGRYVSYVAGGGYRAGPPALNGYTVPLFAVDDFAAPKAAFEIGAYPQSMDFHPTLNLAVVANRQVARFFNIATGESLAITPGGAFGDIGEISRVRFAPSGRYLLVVGKLKDGRRICASCILPITPEMQTALQRPAPPTFNPPKILTFKGLPGVTLSGKERESLDKRLGEKINSTQIGDRFAKSVVVVYTGAGSGSGFFVGSSGTILTCAHVLPRIGEVSVRYRIDVDGKTVNRDRPAKVLFFDLENDLALLSVDLKGDVVPAVHFEGPDRIKQGDAVYIIGNPGLGEATLDNTMTDGIVSAPEREIDGQKFIQTTAAVNPGTSGSPAFNEFGNVIGLVVLKGNIEAAGFAVPVGKLSAFLEAASERAAGR